MYMFRHTHSLSHTHKHTHSHTHTNENTHRGKEDMQNQNGKIKKATRAREKDKNDKRQYNRKKKIAQNNSRDTRNSNMGWFQQRTMKQTGRRIHTNNSHQKGVEEEEISTPMWYCRVARWQRKQAIHAESRKHTHPRGGHSRHQLSQIISKGNCMISVRRSWRVGWFLNRKKPASKREIPFAATNRRGVRSQPRTCLANIAFSFPQSQASSPQSCSWGAASPD